MATHLESDAEHLQSARKNHRFESKPNDYRAATFITCIRLGALEIHSGLSFESKDDKCRIDKLLELWNNYCVGKTNTISERYKFHARAQEPAETIETYASALRTLATVCLWIPKGRND